MLGSFAEQAPPSATGTLTAARVENCAHLRDAPTDTVPRTTEECEDCVLIGERNWVHLRMCLACGHVRYPIGPVCTVCLSEASEWARLSGRGTVFATLVYHQVYNPAYADDVPYNVSMIQLDEGPRLFSNVAVAARHAIDSLGAERVLIFDWDVHHGNGTNAIFHSSPEVLFASIHQYPFYPGTGPLADVGSGAGEGFSLNLPVPGGSGEDVFASLVEHVAAPAARQFRPDLIVVR